MRCQDLFTALWVPDLFIRRVKQDGSWSLFDPDKARGLPDCYGEAFDELYEKYEATPGLANRVVRAKAVWSAMLTAQVEGGTPYVLYKDAINRKSNQKHLGTIKSSNLCAGESLLSLRFGSPWGQVGGGVMEDRRELSRGFRLDIRVDLGTVLHASQLCCKVVRLSEEHVLLPLRRNYAVDLPVLC